MIRSANPAYNPGMANILRVSETEFDRQVDRYLNLALTRTVIVTRDGQDRTVMMSAGEYQRLKRRDRQVYAAGELPDETVEAIRRGEVDPRHQHLDDLIKDWTP
jgi:PHD/YefM family antitoxin component YafN of YafNO toxin-antitoxin module